MSKSILLTFQYYNNRKCSIGSHSPINIDYPHYRFSLKEIIDKKNKYIKNKIYKKMIVDINYSDSQGNSYNSNYVYNYIDSVGAIFKLILDLNCVGNVINTHE